MAKLKDTIEMMSSENWQDRFIAEYLQVKIRYQSLHNMLVKYKAGTLDFTPSCSYEILAEQAGYMGKYLNCLEVRAEIEGVKLPNNYGDK